MFSNVSIYLFFSTYLCVFVVGMLGNVITIVVTVRKRNIWRTLHVYTLNLGVCNLIMLLLYIPTQLVYIKQQLNWTMGLKMCIITNTLLPVSNMCTVGSLLLITFDRFLATTRPLVWRASFAQKSTPAINVVVIFWLVSTAINIPLLLNSELQENGSHTQCKVVWSHDCEYCDYYVYWIVQFIVTYCAPLLIMAIAYPLMARSARKISEEVSRQAFHQRMLVVGARLVVVFAVCTGFQHVFFFMTSSFSGLASLPLPILAHWYALSNLLVSLQAAINPFIYGNPGKVIRIKRFVRISTFRRYVAATVPVRKWTLANFGFIGVGIQRVTQSGIKMKENPSVIKIDDEATV